VTDKKFYETVIENEAKKASVSSIFGTFRLVNSTTPHANMRSFHVCSGAHGIKIVACFVINAFLPGSMIFVDRLFILGQRTRKLANLRRVHSVCAFSRPPCWCSARDKGKYKI